MNIIQEILKELSRALNIPADELEKSLSYPTQEKGDIATNIAIKLSKETGKPLKEIAEDIAKKAKKIDLFSEVNIINGYINFRYNYSKIIRYIEKIDENYGETKEQKEERILIEHTSANPNKAIHIGHLRNACIGDSLVKLLKMMNFKPIVENYIDDTGAQVADDIVGIKYFGFPIEKQGMKIDHYFGDEIYVKVNQEYEKNPALLEKRREILQKIETGDKEITELSDKITHSILQAQLETLEMLGINYDVIVKESDIIRYNLWKTAFEILKEKKEIKLADSGKNAGCWVYMDGNEKPLTRSDGTVLYIGKDIAHAMWKHGLIEDVFLYSKLKNQPSGESIFETNQKGERLNGRYNNVKKSINIIGSEQAINQKIVTEIIKKLSKGEKEYIYYPYELVYLSPNSMKRLGKTPEHAQTKMSGRKGLFFNADDILEDLTKIAYEGVKKRNPEINNEEAERIAKSIAISTIRYEMVKTDPNKAIVFDIDQTLRIEQGSASYLMYSLARANSILRKAGETNKREEAFDDVYLTNMDKELIKKILQFPVVIERSARQLYLPTLATYVTELSLLFNKWYETSPVIKTEEPVKSLRIMLVEKTRTTLLKAFNVLGIIGIEKM